MNATRVRFAPSPTGELHIGGARTALFNYLFARGSGGRFILRIDDTDLERSRNDYTDALIVSLHWLGMEWDEGPYFQSKRLDEYRREAERLLSENRAYRCYCSVEDLAAGREKARGENRSYLYPGKCRDLSAADEKRLNDAGQEHVIRVKAPAGGTTVVSDVIRGEVEFENTGLDDFIIIKSNGMPTYNFASVVDDYQFGITDVIRAEEHLSNTPRQQICFTALGYPLPRFAHVPMILAPDRSKLSKRHGATSVEEFRSQGFLPEALVNYMALLGWSPGDDQEILTLEEMVEKFSLKRVTKTAAIYDTKKLAWMNSHYLRAYSHERLADAARPFFELKDLGDAYTGDGGEESFHRVLAAVRERAKTLVELAEASTYFFDSDFAYDPGGVKKAFKSDGVSALLKEAAAEFEAVEPFDEESTVKVLDKLKEQKGLSTGRLIQPIRLAITGQTGGPGLTDIMSILGRSETVRRLQRAADFIDRDFT